MQQEPTTDIPYGFCQCGCGRETNRWKWSDRSAGRVKGEPARYINGHQPTWDRGTPEQRFWAKVNKNGAVSHHRPDLGPCWEWTGALEQAGYAQFRVGGKRARVHRFSYELLVGPIPEGLTIDHLCKTRHCVNPEHLEPVTAVENVMRGDAVPAVNARKTHCKYGHPFSGANLSIDARGHRRCRQCAGMVAKEVGE